MGLSTLSEVEWSHCEGVVLCLTGVLGERAGPPGLQILDPAEHVQVSGRVLLDHVLHVVRPQSLLEALLVQQEPHDPGEGGRRARRWSRRRSRRRKEVQEVVQEEVQKEEGGSGGCTGGGPGGGPEGGRRYRRWSRRRSRRRSRRGKEVQKDRWLFFLLVCFSAS